MSSTSNKDRKPRGERSNWLGRFRKRNEFYLPLTLEMTCHDAWRSLTPTTALILIDMLLRFHSASDCDTKSLSKLGFLYTYRGCRIDCSPQTFTDALVQIADRGWFVCVSSDGTGKRFVPGKWRAFVAPAGMKLRKYDPVLMNQQYFNFDGKKCKGHFWKSEQIYTPFPERFLTCDAWRSLHATAGLVLIDMLHYFNGHSGCDTYDLDEKGFVYTYAMCRVNCSEGTFDKARKALVKCRWFDTPPMLQKGGTIRYRPGGWQHYTAPDDATFRKAEVNKQKYGEKNVTRQINFRSRINRPPRTWE